MPQDLGYPREWLDRVPARVFAVFVRNEIQLVVPDHPDGQPRAVPLSVVPFELRIPNALVWAQLDEDMNVIRVWARSAGE